MSDDAQLISRGPGGTALVLIRDGDALPAVAWLGPHQPGLDADAVAAAVGGPAPITRSQDVESRPVSLLPGPAQTWLGRPGLSGHRLGRSGPPLGDPAAAAPPTGRDWSPAWHTDNWTTAPGGDASTIQASDAGAGLALRTDIDAVPGGALRIRHTLTNTGAADYVVDALEVSVPIPPRVTEALDGTGRWAYERVPQRHRITDGTWLRESRGGRPGFDSPTLLVAGSTSFGFGAGEVWGVHVAWSGNSRYLLHRQPSGVTVLGGGELLLPGEICLAPGASYATPWVYLSAAADGLDGLADQFHCFERTLPAHPTTSRPVNLNVWEAVYFDHDLATLTRLAELGAQVGVERFVLDDGWFRNRHGQTAGLGDWTVDLDSWPDGLSPLIDHVRGLGLQFGLWFEPEMVNPDSELYRAHPEWTLATGGRVTGLHRDQLVLDLGRPEVRRYLIDALDAILTAHRIDYVKWDHNRPLVDAGTGRRDGAPGVHDQTEGFYAVLDELRRRHPLVEWESCASGGARIDLAVLERVQRVWTSDQNDALVRQSIQRWTAQLIAPEYLGAHIAGPVSHQTGRRLPLEFRAATALFGHLGLEWDLSTASADELAELAAWIQLYRTHRGLLHGGRTVRVDSEDAAVLMHGVVAPDRQEAIFSYVQLVESPHDPTPLRVPGLAAETRYVLHRLNPSLAGGAAPWAGENLVVTGAVLGSIGVPAPARGALTALVIHLERA